jgi:oxygen-independent coproporphyrinogen-3 oxidase
MPGVYVSYPFCAQKCTYCNFASGVATASERRRYEHALLAEVRQQNWPWQPETVYWGGGTPSLMPLEFLQAVMAAIPRERLSEVTIEAEPGTVTSERAEAWHDCGVNRVSLGVQSFVTEEVRRTGRKHTPEIVVDSVQTLRDAGITNVNLDLIAGLPGQTAASWRQSLSWIERIEPSHVSVYLFEMDEDSRLGREALIGGVRYGAALLPDDNAMASFYEAAVEHLARIGFRRYEISNFARDRYESRHNLKYWRLEPYLGFGVDAHSFDGRLRWSNSDSVSTYVQHIERGVLDRFDSSAANVEEERFFIGLRQAIGIEPSEAEWLRFNEPINRGISAGVLERAGSHLRLTDRGFLISNEILQEFIA